MSERPHQTYLRRAAEVEALAAKIEFVIEREAMLKIAAEWRRLAEAAQAGPRQSQES